MAEPTDLRINFIRPGKRNNHGLIIAATALAIALLTGWCVYSHCSSNYRLADKTLENARLSQELEQVGSLSNGLAGFQGMHREAQAIQAAIDMIGGDRLHHAPLLEDIYRLAPSGMRLTRIEANKDIIKLSGTCPDYFTLGRLLAASDSYSDFGKVQKITSNLAQPATGPIEFVLEVEYKRAGK